MSKKSVLGGVAIIGLFVFWDGIKKVISEFFEFLGVAIVYGLMIAAIIALLSMVASVFFDPLESESNSDVKEPVYRG